MSDETPLEALEKDSADFRKEVEENMKKWSKLTLKAANNDQQVYRQSLEEALAQAEDNRLEASELLADANQLSKDDEPSTLKPKDFQKRQAAEVRKLKDLQAKIDKAFKKVKADLDKQVKLDEKRGVVKEKGSKEEEVAEGGSEAVKERGLKELMMEEERKALERKRAEEEAPESKKEKEKRLKEEKRLRKEEEKRQKEEKKREKAGERKGVALAEEGEAESEESEVESDAEVRTGELSVIARSVREIEERSAVVGGGKNQELVRIVREVKAVEGRYKSEEKGKSTD